MYELFGHSFICYTR